jgi:hypothetical protein
MITPSFSLTATERVLPRLALDFTTASLDPRITFTRTGNTATVVNSSGLIEPINADLPRFDYNPITLACQGLLIEESRTNLATYSQDFTNGGVTGWGAINLTPSADTTVSPDGTQNADSLFETTTNAQHRLDKITTILAGSYTFSCFLKSAGSRYASIRIDSAGAYIDLNSGTATNVGATSFSSVSYGNGWYRLIISVAAAAALATIRINNNGASTGIAPSYAGNPVNAIVVWGAQLEAGAFATSYIPTVASTVTRTADVAVMTGTNFSSWFNASAGTFRATYEASPNTFTAYFVASNGVTAQNSIHFDNDSGNMRAVYYSGSSAVATLGLGAVGIAGTVNSAASSYAVNNFVAARNAGSVVTDTAGAVPLSLTQMNIGADPSGTAANVMNTRIQKIFYYPLALTNAEVQAFSK